MNRILPVALSGLALALSGCAIGFDTVFFATRSNLGVDIDTQPPTAEISIARRELVIGPSFEGGQKPPVLASFRSNIRGILGLWANVASTFAGGDAADTMTKYFGDPDKTDAVDSRLCLSKKPVPTVLGSSRQLPGPGETRPFVFATDTTIGLKVAWSGTTAQYPDSLKFGYNRKEFAFAPVFASRAGGARGRIEAVKGQVLLLAGDRALRIGPASRILVGENVVALAEIKPGMDVHVFSAEVGTLDAKGAFVPRSSAAGEPTLSSKCSPGEYEVAIAPFLATVDHETRAGPPDDTGGSHLQYFATGRSATNLTLRRDVRAVMLKRLDPEAAKRLRTFRDHQKAQQAAFNHITAEYAKATPDKQARILEEAQKLKVVSAATTRDQFTAELFKSVDANNPTRTEELEKLDEFVKEVD